MRILFLYPRRLDTAVTAGGVAEFLFSLCPTLKSMAVTSYIYTGDKNAKLIEGPFTVTNNITIYKGPYIKPSFFVRGKKIAALIALCKRLKIDAVHAQGTYTAGFLALQMFKQAGIPYVVTSHSDILAINSKRMLRFNVQRRCKQILKHATAVTHLTPIMAKASHALLDTTIKSTTIGNGIDYQEWQSVSELPEKNYLLGIGRLERGKGFHILIDMYARLVQQGFTEALVIAGQGSAENEFQEQAKRLGLNVLLNYTQLDNIPDKSVVFTGYVRGEQKKKLIAESKIIFFATQPAIWEEAFGIVQLEAMAAGKPIIASHSDVTHYLQAAGMQALTVEPDNVDAWTKQTAQLLSHPELRQQLGQGNLQAATKFGWEPIAEQYKQVYASCLQK